MVVQSSMFGSCANCTAFIESLLRTLVPFQWRIGKAYELQIMFLFYLCVWRSVLYFTLKVRASKLWSDLLSRMLAALHVLGCRWCSGPVRPVTVFVVTQSQPVVACVFCDLQSL